jgi:hypothetical protein
MSTGRMSNHQIPTITNDVPHIPTIVRPGNISGKKITTHGIMTTGEKSIPN